MKKTRGSEVDRRRVPSERSLRPKPGLRTVLLLGLGLFVSSLIVHLLYLGQIYSSPFFNDPYLDSFNYHQKALQILGSTDVDEDVPLFNPLYPYVLSFLYRFMEEPSFYAVRVVQSILGALSCVLILLVGVRFFDFRTGLLAAIAALLYAPFLFYDGELIQISWVLFFTLLVFWSFPLAHDFAGRGRRARALLAGFFFGLALLGRPNLLPYLVVI